MLFWINVILAILLVLIILSLFDRVIFKFESNLLKNYLKILAYVLIGFVYHASLFWYNNKLMGLNDRFPWQSDIFSGKFSDVLVGSPFLNRFIPRLDN